MIVLRRKGTLIQFGAAAGDAPAAFPWAPFPDLLAIDTALRGWVRESLGLKPIRIHERFVERPDPEGAIYYLVETSGAPAAPDIPLQWLDAGQAARLLARADRAALARAMRYLAGAAARPG